MASTLWQRSRRVRRIVSISAALAGACSVPTMAQTQLPGIVVRTPSPVASPTSAAPAQATTAPQLPVAPPVDIPSLTFIVPDAFVPLTIVTSREITSTPGATLTDSLQYKPGIAGTNFAPAPTAPSSAASTAYRVRVQENGIGAHDVSAMCEDHAIPIDPSRPTRRGGARPRHAALWLAGDRRRRQRRATNASPTFIPPRGFTGRDHAAASLRRRRRRRRLQGHGRRRQLRRARRRFRPPHRRLRHAARPPAQLVRRQRRLALGTSLVGTDGFIGVAFRDFNSLYGIPGDEAAEEGTRIDMQQDKMHVERRMARPRLRHRGDPLLVRLERLRAQRAADPRWRPSHRLALHQPRAGRPCRGPAPARQDRRWASCAERSACRSAIATCRA